MRLCGLFLILSFLCSSAFAQSEKEKIFSLMATVPKATKAKILRGKTELTVDLSQEGAKSVIKDYDVIILDEGVYSTLGNFTAKYVRVRGQGPRKTFISSIAKDSSPIMVNSTEFWDLTMADVQFKINDLSGLWAVNVEFAGSILVRPATLDKSPAFAIRSVFSDLTNSDLPADDGSLYSHFLTKYGEEYLMPLPGDYKELKEKPTAAKLLAYEDQFDRADNIHLKNRIGHKGLFARGLNYLYQKEVLIPQYNQAKFNQLTKSARTAKANRHYYVSMLYWAEADRLAGHSRFDEVLKEITPLTQNLSQECGCTVEGQGLATNIKSEIEQNLYTKLPITGLPGPCKIQTLHVNIPEGGKKAELIAAARLEAQQDQATAFGAREYAFQKSVIAHSGNSKSEPEEFLMGASAPVAVKDYTVVADVEMSGVKKSYSSDQGTSIAQNIIDPITKIFSDKFASKIKAAKAKIASTDLVAKFDGFIIQALYGSDMAKQNEYESLHEQQFGRKSSSSGAISSVFAY